MLNYASGVKRLEAVTRTDAFINPGSSMEEGKYCRDFRFENPALIASENYRMRETNRCAKTSFLQLREDAFESLGGLRWFLPLQAVSLLSKVSTVAFCLARLLEALAARPL